MIIANGANPINVFFSTEIKVGINKIDSWAVSDTAFAELLSAETKNINDKTIIGPIEATPVNPKLSSLFPLTEEETPRPRESMNGTAKGPVVAPDESKLMAISF